MKGGQSPSLELVSREFRKQRLEPWAAGRGAGQDESQLQEDTSKLAGGRAEGRVKSKFVASF